MEFSGAMQRFPEEEPGEIRAPAMALKPFHLDELQSASPAQAAFENLADVELELRIEMGTTQMNLSQVMKLRKGALVPLDNAVADPVRIYADEQLVAYGEVMVLNEQFCVRVTELVDGGVTKSLQDSPHLGSLQ